MLAFKRPKYKFYLKFLKNINELKLKKLNSLKWKNFKESSSFKSELRKKKKLSFFSHSGCSKNQKDSLFKDYGDIIFKYNFKNSLITKKRLLHYYCLKDYQLKNIVKKINISKENNKYLLLKILEKRLDIILYKSGFVKTIFESKQLINHNKIYVNKKIESKCGYITKPGDLIEIKDLKLQTKTLFFKKKQYKKNKKIKKKLKSFFFKKDLKKKITLKKNINILSKLKENNLNILNKKRFKIKGKKKKNFFLYLPLLFSSHLEINYKTYSIIVLKEIESKSSFSFWVNLSTIYQYYYFH